jgi:hypothetical protein
MFASRSISSRAATNVETAWTDPAGGPPEGLLIQETLMPTTTKSPFASTFKTLCKKGVPCSVAIETIANRFNKSTTFVTNSLCKAGFCWKQKFNGQWICFPTFPCKTTATKTKNCQFTMWQCFVDWCCCSGFCTPKQLMNHCGSQAAFTSFCKKFWNKQFNATTSKSSGKTFKFPKTSYKMRHAA